LDGLGRLAELGVGRLDGKAAEALPRGVAVEILLRVAGQDEILNGGNVHLSILAEQRRWWQSSACVDQHNLLRMPLLGDVAQLGERRNGISAPSVGGRG
jgi:hypothetical protein